MLKLKLQYFGHLMQRADSLEKTLMLGKREGRRRRERQRIRWLDGITDLMGMSLSKLGEIDSEGQGSLARCSPWCCKESDRTEQLNSNSTPIKIKFFLKKLILTSSSGEFLFPGNWQCCMNYHLSLTFYIFILLSSNTS